MEAVTVPKAIPKVETLTVEAKPCLTLRGKVTMEQMPDFLQTSFGKLYAHVCPKTQPGECFARYPSWTDEQFEVEVGVTTREALPSEGEFLTGTLGGHKAVHMVHKGPYATISGAYNAIQHEIKTNELKTSGAPYEIYLNDPREVPQEEILTGVYWPIE